MLQSLFTTYLPSLSLSGSFILKYFIHSISSLSLSSILYSILIFLSFFLCSIFLSLHIFSYFLSLLQSLFTPYLLSLLHTLLPSYLLSFFLCSIHHSPHIFLLSISLSLSLPPKCQRVNFISNFRHRIIVM